MVTDCFMTSIITSMKINARILGLFVFIVLSWATAWPINKIGLDYISPLWFTCLRLIIATITMMGLVILLKKFSWPRKEDLPLIFIIGLLQISFYILLTNMGLAYCPAGHSTLLAYTTPLWVMPCAILLFNEQHTALKWLGLVLGMGGLVVLLSPWELDWTNKKIVLGNMMLLLASLMWAISILCTRYMRWTKSPLELIPWQLLIGTIPVLLYAGFKEPIIIVNWSTPLLLSLLYTGILVTGISYWLCVIVNKELPTITLSLGFLIVPVISLILSAIFLHENITAYTMSAMMLILAGTVCVAL